MKIARRPWGHAHRHELIRARLAKQGAEAVFMGDFSPGPWWGYNGVQTLAVTAEKFMVARQSWGPFRQVRIVEMDVSSLGAFDVSERPARLRHRCGKPGTCIETTVKTVDLRVGRRRHRYTPHHAAAADELVFALASRPASDTKEKPPT